MKIKQQDITSHFIGIKLKSTRFKSLFADLQLYIRQHDLENIICLTNIDSLHITLYYLSKDLTTSHIQDIHKTINELKNNSLEKIVELDELKYFRNKSMDTLAYLTSKQDHQLIKLNNILKQNYKKDDIPDNLLQYIPHCTLFTIKQNSKYLENKEELVKIINDELSILTGENLYEKICLFQVNSTHNPEIQVPIY